MRAFKRTLSILLCCVLLAAFAPMAYAGDVLLEAASATFAVPAGGEPFDFSAITVPDGAHYTAKIAKIYTRDGKEEIADGGIVTGGVTYVVRVSFSADKNYTFEDGKTIYTVNGESVSEALYPGVVETSFVAAGEAPAEPEPSKPTFRDRVAQFFRDMRNRFLFVIYFIRYLFGIKT